jgi:hypothetical protein
MAIMKKALLLPISLALLGHSMRAGYLELVGGLIAIIEEELPINFGVSDMLLL